MVDLVLVVFVELQHLQHVVAVDQLVLQLLGPHELSLEQRPLDVYVVLNPVELLLLKVKDCLLLEHLFTFLLKPLARRLDLLREHFELYLLGIEVELPLLQLLPVSLDELGLLLQEPLLAAQLVLVVGQRFLAVLDFDLLGLDVADVVLSLLLL